MLARPLAEDGVGLPVQPDMSKGAGSRILPVNRLAAGRFGEEAVTTPFFPGFLFVG